MTDFKRFWIALMAALVFAGATLLVVQAKTLPVRLAAYVTVQETITPTAQPPVNCASCHKDTHDSWDKGPHGQARISGIFQKEWQAQGQPGACLVCHSTGYDPTTGKSKEDGVACAACHSPVPDNHPANKMPVNTSPDLCGKCHSNPSFGPTNWQASTHYQRGMTCSVCHDPHSAGMKTVAGVSGDQPDASALCANCHKDAMKNFPTSKHAQAGVTCVNCHLDFNAKDKTFEDAHKIPDHDFLPSLDTCNKCHADQMHSPGQAMAAAAIKIEQLGGTPTPNPTPAVTAVPVVSSEPIPVSPLGFAGIAGLLGLAGGMVLAPWLERAYHRYIEGRNK
jgi:predicted CXXCH cytochrome family protein